MDKMTPRERIVTAVKHEETDRIPLDMTICEKPYLDLIDHFGIDRSLTSAPDKWGEISMIPELAEALGVDCLFLKPGKIKKRDDKTEESDLMTDDWGIVRKKTYLKDGSYYWEIIEHPLKDATLEDLRHFPWPDPDDPTKYEDLPAQGKELYENTDFCIIGRFNSAVFETAWYLRGLEGFLTDLMVNKEFAKKLLNKICDIQVKAALNCIEVAGKYVQIVRFGDDLGTQIGPLISPEIFDEIVKPVLCRDWTTIKKALRKQNPEGFIMLHTCGNVYEFIPDFIECELDILDPIQKVSGMEIGKLKEEFGERLTFHGAIDTQRLLPYASPQQVKEEVKKVIEILGKGGGFIAAPVHNVQSDVPFENLIALSEAIKESANH